MAEADLDVAEALSVFTDQNQDGLLLIAAHRFDDPVDEVVIDGVRADGATVTLRTPSGDRSEHIHFDQPVTSVQSFYDGFRSLLDAARAARPDAPLTLYEAHQRTGTDQQVFYAPIARITDLSPNLRALTIGPVDGFWSIGWDQTVRLQTDLPGQPVPSGLSTEAYKARTEAERH
ncbi:MAG: hypothetical protein AAGG08_15225, partial [Actinomycetota bacterium]